MKQHKANIHYIDVNWFYCDQDECDFKCKNNSHLKEHKEFVHDIGKHKCDFCLNHRNSHIEYEDSNKVKSSICRKCYQKVTGKKSRAEKIWSDYLDEHFGTEYLLGSDKSLKSMGGCTLKRPDKLYASPDTIFLCECDEHQHLYENGTYQCDEKRITDIYNTNFVTKQMIVIRWNPDSYKPLKDNKKKDKKDLR